jgi:pyruvate,orthophosphate dikinase
MDSTLVGKGRAATRISARGVVVLDCESAKTRGANESVILVRAMTVPEDLEGIVAAEGILTARGGVLSHAAIVAIELEKACIVGAGFAIQGKALVFPDGSVVKEGERIHLDGQTGQIRRDG